MSTPQDNVNRRKFLTSSGAVILGSGTLALGAEPAQGQDKQPKKDPPKKEPPPDDRLAPQKPRDIAPLALNADGSAREFTEKDLTPIKDIGVLYRNTKNQPPKVEFDPAKHKIRIRGNVMKLHGAMGLADLEKLPPCTQISKLQCGAQKPSGIIKWTGVRMADVCKMLDVQAMCQYVMFISADGYVTSEDIAVAANPQTLLVWQMNDKPLLPEHGAPYRLVIPFRWGGRYIKAITEIRFTATSFGYNNS